MKTEKGYDELAVADFNADNQIQEINIEKTPKMKLVFNSVYKSRNYQIHS